MRNVRWGLVVLVMTGAAACGGKMLTPPGGTGTAGTGGNKNRWVGSLQPLNRNVDILFLIDDSSSMDLQQSNLIRNFPTFMTRLQDPPGLPNIHIAVVSQDMGAGDGSIAGCDSVGGKNGIFQYTARGTCASSGLQAGATYISNIAGVANYTGNAADVFACIAALGSTGCGFEHQFAAITRALGVDGRGAAPAENQDFLRPDAYLAIIMLTNEDDCSAAPGVPLFDTSSNTNVASQLGPPANFRCNEFGHLCDPGTGSYVHPSRLAPNNDVNQIVSYPSCRSNEAEGYLLGAEDTANRIKALKSDPAQVAVFSIQGPVNPYNVSWKNPSTSDTSCGAASCPWPMIAHSCTASDGSFADPGVRTAEFVKAFGDHGMVLPICSDNLAPSLDRAASMINSLFGPPCLTGLGPDPARPGQADCKVTQHTSNGLGGFIDSNVPACADNGGVPPCWQLARQNVCNGFVLNVSPDPNIPASTASNVSYDCAKCTSADPLADCLI
jgi:hypothetical protein